MFRATVSILVLLGFVAGQVAAVPHAHGGYSRDQQERHDERPHIHLPLLGHWHADHDHSHGGYSHRHGAAGSADAQPLPLGASAPGPEHDDDAIYLPGGASYQIVGKQQRTTLRAAPLPLAAPGSEVIGIQSNSCTPEVIHPPDHQAHGKLYLRLRTLRI